MRAKRKSWRSFPAKGAGIQKAINQRIRRMCGILLFAEAVILWKQMDIPLISVDRQSFSWENPVKALDDKEASRKQPENGLAASEEEEERTVFEQIFGVRVRLEDGVIEFYRKEEKVDVMPKEK